MQGAIKELFW